MAESKKADRCRIAWEVATEIAAEECGSPEESMGVLGDIMGIELDNPVSETCKAVLEAGMTKDRCADFRGIRQFVVCNAHRLMTEEKKPFRDAIRDSWSEAKTECAKLGVVV